MKLLLVVVIVAVIAHVAWTIPIDNGVEDDPEVECGATGMTINFNIRNPFEGHVYVKGRFAESGCRSDEGGRKVAGITLAFSDCGTERTRSLNPRGVFVRQTVVISFHPQFLTKVDRAYTIQCFYMEADKTVSQEIEVSDITTAFQSQVVPMPVCRYDILEGGPTGQPIKFALIGQAVFHKWTCDTETTDIFCMIVHSCTVDDGAGNKANLLNENGCALDRFLLQNLEYTTDLMAGREAHVFKYADKAALFFSCQISITIKEPGTPCAKPECGEPGGIGGAIVGGAGASPRPGATIRPALVAGSAKPSPPHGVTGGAKTAGTGPAHQTPSNSPSPRPGTTGGAAPAVTTPPPPAATSPAAPTTGAATPPKVLNDTAAQDVNAVQRKRRSATQQDRLGVWDVHAQPITALDIDEEYNVKSLKETSKLLTSVENDISSPPSMDFCLSPSVFSLIIATTIVSGLLAGFVSMVLCIRRPSTKFSS